MRCLTPVDGSGQIFQQSSKDIYGALISTASVPPVIADQKKNKAVSVQYMLLSRVSRV